MAVASKLDLEKKSKELDKHLNKLADPKTGQQKIPTLMTMVRGAIRSSWAISPMKLAYHEMGRTPDISNTPRKWKWQCEYCGAWLNESCVEYDHTTGNHTFTKPEDFVGYFDNILDVQFKDIQRICKYRCHRVKSHMEKQNLPSMSYAGCDKINIFLTKFVGTVNYTDWLSLNNITPESSAPKRKKQGLTLLLSKGLEEEVILDMFESCDHLMRLEAKKKKAKNFKLTSKDYNFITTYKNFWEDNGMIKPKLTLSFV